MCGISGVVDLEFQREPDRSLLEAMNDSQRHRGPDGFGYHVETGVGFAHRRLSIIDLASGQQPLANEDGSVIVTFNGEIYNFPELTRELKDRGHSFRTHSDTETIVHAWEEWGEACVERFRGMFAFALWDRNRATLFLARDRLGKKPLHYAVVDGRTLVFGSELSRSSFTPGFAGIWTRSRSRSTSPTGTYPIRGRSTPASTSSRRPTRSGGHAQGPCQRPASIGTSPSRRFPLRTSVRRGRS